MRKNTKGFTLAELLIVVAIIAVLVAISIPIFTSQLEKAREAVDLSNVRSAYSILQNSIMTETPPDGKEWGGDGAFYIYMSSGEFQRLPTLGLSDISGVCKLKSKSANLSDYLNMDWSYCDISSGWKDCVILIYYDEPNGSPVMYVNQL